MKTTIYIFIILIVTFLSNTACEKDCHGDVLPDKKFSLTEIAIVPYSGGKSYIFKDSTNDSICFNSHNPVYDMEKVSETLPTYPGEDLEGCIGDTRYSEIISWGLWTSQNRDTAMVIYIRYYHPFGEDENLKDIYIMLTYNQVYLEFSGWFSFYNYRDDKDTIVSLGHSSQSLYSHGTYQVSAYHYTIDLNGHSFDKVYEMAYHGGFGDVTIYYSISLGIVGFKDRFGVLWHLEKIL